MIFPRVKKIVKQIPKGKVTTYGKIAKIIGIKDARVVGWALHQNKDQSIPCHRVVNRFGMVAKSYAFGGAKVQKEKLKKEGVKFINENQVDLSYFLWEPKK